MKKIQTSVLEIVNISKSSSTLSRKYFIRLVSMDTKDWWCHFLIYGWTSISSPFGELATCLGDVAYCEELVDNLDSANNASGKLGGVAGVLAGAHNWKRQNKQ